MKTIISLILLVMFMACTANAVTVTGTVKSSDAKPVAEATVYVIKRVGVGEPKIVTKTISSVDGTFKINLEPIRTIDQCYIFAARTKNGYFGWSKYLLQKCTNNENISVEISGSKVGDYQGKVIDNNGKPLAGVRVKPDAIWIRGSDTFSSWIVFEMLKPLMQFSSAVTDKQGIYVLKGIPRIADVRARAEKAGFAEKIEYREYINNITLMPAGSISGRVVDAYAKPIKGLHIFADAGYNPSCRAVTADNGTYKLGPLLPGLYHVALDSEELAAAVIKDVRVIGGKTSKIRDMRVVKGVFWRGKVVDVDTGKPLPKSGIIISGPTSPGLTTYLLYKTDKKGIYNIPVVPGNYTADVYSPGYDSLPKSDGGNDAYDVAVNVGNKGISDVLIKLKKLPMGKGKVLDESGKPVPNASINMRIGSKTAKTDSNGKFEIELPTKEEAVTVYDTLMSYVYVKAEFPNLNLGVVERIARNSLLNEKAVLHLKPTRTQTITVIDKTWTPMQDAIVSVWRKEDDCSMIELSSVTNAEAKASFEVCEGGIYYFTVAHKGYRENYSLFFDGQDIAVGSPNWNNEIILVMDPKSANLTLSGEAAK